MVFKERHDEKMNGRKKKKKKRESTVNIGAVGSTNLQFKSGIVVRGERRDERNSSATMATHKGCTCQRPVD